MRALEPIFSCIDNNVHANRGNEKTFGLDSFTDFFFKSAWGIVGPDFLEVVQYFFAFFTLLATFNATSISLVPKCDNLSYVKDFQPISYCSAVYKCTTKVLVNRMTPFLPALIFNSQSAFVRRRSIIDNTMLAYELIQGYGRRHISPRCTLKVNLQKTFDSLHWGFLLSVLRAQGFPEKFLKWIEVCLTTPQFSVSFNGSLVSELFVAGVPQKELALMTTCTGFKVGKLPMRILDKIQEWSTKYLSYDGRLQLIKTVIFSVQTYWSCQFLMPKSVLKKVYQYCLSFFWKGKVGSGRGARVYWKAICLPKYEWGLGLKNVVEWNQACILQLIRTWLPGEGFL
ncbi:hypothetical protein J1N35_008258 [Gossypium stocksii]|uniref:Reverse transcriptase domain-containing protein n=1 Tax=Gossypium stocksii TaxID=47602 RepID=A0A9D3WAN9_9ROSI|nr:hypothetical protein J1N35_008258 [Gossypium stocksii]